METMIIDCDTCQVRGASCQGCVISALLGVPDTRPTTLDDEEQRVLGLFADSGLLPPLRLVRPIASALTRTEEDENSEEIRQMRWG